MSSHQLRRLDQALLALIDERARLIRDGDGTLHGRSPADVLRRYDGPLSPAALTAVLAAIDAACDETPARTTHAVDADERNPAGAAPQGQAPAPDESAATCTSRPTDAPCGDATPDGIAAGPRRDDR